MGEVHYSGKALDRLKSTSQFWARACQPKIVRSRQQFDFERGSETIRSLRDFN